MTASGKVLKRVLTDMVKKGTLKPQFLRENVTEAAQ